MKQFGIDISAWQGNYDLRRAKEEGVKFVILKGGGGDDGLYKDSRFEQNYKKAKDLGLPVGVYWFSKALTVSSARREAEYFYNNCLKGKTFELPVYIDVENKSQLAVGKRLLTNIIKEWCSYLQNLKYYVGIYSSSSYFRSYMYDSELKDYAHWVAQWSKAYTGDAGMWQFGGEINYIRTNKVAGQTTDQNYMLYDYPPVIKKGGFNGYSKQPDPTPTPSPKKKLEVDGIFGYLSTLAMQKWLGTYEDGEISNQLSYLKQYYTAITTATFGGGGSPCIMALQRLLKVEEDGLLGQDTIKAWQKFLNKNGAKLVVDGYFGEESAKAMQKYLNNH